MIALLAALLLLLAADDHDGDSPWWGPEVSASIARVPERREAWEDFLQETPAGRREGVAYLMASLPLADLEKLETSALKTNVDLAYESRAAVRWGDSLPDEVFYDSVLPMASVTEPREPMRAEFRDRYLDLVRDSETPGAAALKLNATLFRDYKVTYNTRRLRTDQSSRESIAQGMATCTGLSIMFVEAARAVGIPARLAGIHSWPGRGGNHTWVEVWDDGWHFLGAAEPDPAGLDHAWFVGDASKAVANEPRHAIWAVTYRPTGSTFPLVWAPHAAVPAENVSTRYRGDSATAGPRLMVEVRDGGERVEAAVTASGLDDGTTVLEGTSLGPGADVNLHLEAPAVEGSRVLVTARHRGRSAVGFAKIEGDTVVRLALDAPLDDDDRKALAALLADRFGDDPGRREVAAKLLQRVPFPDWGRELAWSAYRESPRHKALRAEWEESRVTTPDRASAYLWRSVGDPEAKGRSLVIAMHGGGGAPKRVNDSQWRGMFERYYRDHPEAGNYVYLALRAPNDEWNGFYDDAIVPLVERLILQFVLFGGVDPDRVVILGASHGGYGAFVIGPKIPDRFAAIHASASAPTPGETAGVNLRNVRFTFMVGEDDTAYGRADRCREFAEQLASWKADYGGFPGGMELLPDVGHSVPDRDKVAELLVAGSRDPKPDRLIWVQSDDVVQHHYWLEAPEPAEGGRIEATAEGNTIRLRSENQNRVALWLDAPLIDLTKPVTIEVEGSSPRAIDPVPDLGTYCDGIELRGDPKLAAPLRVEVDLGP